MRCNNCGWDNTPGATNCVKCGYSLQVSDHYGMEYRNEQPRPTVINPETQMHPMPKPTVLDATGYSKPEPRPTRIVNTTEAGQGNGNCPNCGYPVAAGFTSCPNCGTSMSQASTMPQNKESNEKKTIKLSDYGIDENVKCQNCGTDVSIEFSFCPKCGEKVHLPTVRAIRHKPTEKQIKSRCSLSLVLEEDEVTQERKNIYEGDAIMLNRDNTEPDNRTITSREQAELSYKDGKWYIINKSELCSTYIEPRRAIELQSGDIIVMGDRKFKFETES